MGEQHFDLLPLSARHKIGVGCRDITGHVARAFAFFDESLGDREFLAGERFSMADILLLTTVDFAKFVGCGPGDDLPALTRWHETVSARPSASA